MSVPNIYGKYPNSEEGTWRNKDLEAGRIVKDLFLEGKKKYLIEKLKYQFTLLILKDMLSNEDKNALEAHNIKI